MRAAPEEVEFRLCLRDPRSHVVYGPCILVAEFDDEGGLVDVFERDTLRAVYIPAAGEERYADISCPDLDHAQRECVFRFFGGEQLPIARRTLQ